LVAVLAGLATVISSLALLGNGNKAVAQDSGLEAGVTATVRAAVDAYNRRDFGAFISYWTDKGFMEEIEFTKAEAATDEEFFGDQIVLRAVRDITATSTGATAIVELEFGLGVEANKFTFILVDGRWRIDGSTAASAAIPPGTNLVDMKLQEYAFVYDKNAVVGGNIAFKAQNVGREDHEIVVVKVDASLAAADFLETIMSEGEGEEEGGPPPFEDFGFLGVFKPGDSGTAAFSRTLGAGKYFLVCFLEAPDGLPHIAKGMISEFTVGPGTGGAIRPPSTGDAGLIGGSGNMRAALQALGVTLLFAGAFAGLRSRRLHA
jgi:hypothetical protein